MQVASYLAMSKELICGYDLGLIIIVTIQFGLPKVMLLASYILQIKGLTTYMWTENC